MLKQKGNKAFTLIEILVVIVIIIVFVIFAAPNVTSYMSDREVRKEVYETVDFIKERKSEVHSGKYGMTQIILNRQLQVATMTSEQFIKIYKRPNSPYPSHKKNRTCGFMNNGGFTRQSKYDKEDFGVYVPDSNVHIYPSAWHNPIYSVVCITQDGSIEYDKPHQIGRKKSETTGQMIDYFVFCSKSNSTETTCKFNSKLDKRYMIELDRFQNIEVYKYNVKKDKWTLQ